MELPVAKVLRAFSARFLFAVHGLVVIWRVASIYGDNIYWLFGICLIAIFIEGGLVIYQRHGNETTWFCLSVFLYLCCTVPPIWFLQIQLCRKGMRKLERNITIFDSDQEMATFHFAQNYKITVVIPLRQEMWVQLLQQTMLLILILGRWMLPKGDISRDHLSQMLLVFLGMAADMVELFDTFKEDQVKFNMRLTEIVLAVWSVSLIQFPLVLTGKSPKKSRFGYMKQYFRSSVRYVQSTYTYKVKEPSAWRFFFNVLANDIGFWAIITGIVLQDAPFLATRLYLLIKHKTISYIMIFFTCKNILVVLLQSYRLYVICLETRAKVFNARNAFRSGKTLTKDGEPMENGRSKSEPISPRPSPGVGKLFPSQSVPGMLLPAKGNGCANGNGSGAFDRSMSTDSDDDGINIDEITD